VSSLIPGVGHTWASPQSSVGSSPGKMEPVHLMPTSGADRPVRLTSGATVRLSSESGEAMACDSHAVSVMLSWKG